MRFSPAFAVLLLVVSAACNRPDVRERESVAASNYEVAENAFLGGLTGIVTVDAASRDAMETWEIGSTTRIIYEESNPPSGQTDINVNLTNVASETLSDGYGDPKWEGAPFGDCSNPGFTELDNGGCSLDVVVFVSTNIESSFTVDLVVRGWLPEGDSTDTESMELTVDVAAIAPE